MFNLYTWLHDQQNRINRFNTTKIPVFKMFNLYTSCSDFIEFHGIPKSICIPSGCVWNSKVLDINNELRWTKKRSCGNKKGAGLDHPFRAIVTSIQGYSDQVHVSAIALPRMLYAADIFLPQIPVNLTHAGKGKRRGGQATLTRLALIQRKAAIVISSTGEGLCWYRSWDREWGRWWDLQNG